MPPLECQKHYDEIMETYHQTVNLLTLKYQNGIILHSYFVVHVNIAVDQANSDAHTYTDCSGWQNLSHIE